MKKQKVRRKKETKPKQNNRSRPERLNNTKLRLVTGNTGRLPELNKVSSTGKKAQTAFKAPLAEGRIRWIVASLCTVFVLLLCASAVFYFLNIVANLTEKARLLKYLQQLHLNAFQ